MSTTYNHVCDTCGREFSRNDNLQRHIASLHPSAPIGDSPQKGAGLGHRRDIFNEAPQYDRESESDSEEEMEEEESVSDEEEEEEEGGADDQEMDQESEADKDPDHWRDIVIEAAGKMEYDEPADLLKEPHLSGMVNEMRQLVEGRLEFAAYIQNEDGIYDKIQKAKNRYEEDEDDEEVVQETAWHDKRFSLKHVIEDNLDALEESDDNESDAEQDAEDDNDE